VSNATATKQTELPMVFSQEAFTKNVQRIKPYDGFAGAIAIDNKGNIFHKDSQRWFCQF
jgi:L-asparaginase